jgi:CTP synthase
MVEIPGHPFFLGCQFHPEFKSKPLEPHPIFSAFVKASYGNRMRGKEEGTAVRAGRNVMA